MRAWDFVHCEPGGPHVFVGAGEAVLDLQIGARRADQTLDYPADERAARYGAAAPAPTVDGPEAYADGRTPPRRSEGPPTQALFRVRIRDSNLHGAFFTRTWTIPRHCISVQERPEYRNLRGCVERLERLEGTDVVTVLSRIGQFRAVAAGGSQALAGSMAWIHGRVVARPGRPRASSSRSALKPLARSGGRAA
ncbi:MAG: hypothetical protein QOG06_1696 [Gaiellaceae bacterium]|nr:hypothetical protein [Gaiellaceae bacterium]